MEAQQTSRTGNGKSDAPVIDKRSPVTGEPLGKFPIASKEDVQAAVQRARDAFPALARHQPRRPAQDARADQGDRKSVV